MSGVATGLAVTGAASTAPPTPPGGLTRLPTTAATRTYLAALDVWLDQLRSRVNRLDADAQLADQPTRYTGDVTLAMSLVHSIASRHDELVSAWDSGRVDDDVLARIGVLLWGRLPDPLGAPSAFTLSEAATLATALVDRLVAELATDPLAGSGVAGRVAALRGAISRCVAHARALGLTTTDLESTAAFLEAAVGSKDRTRVVAAVGSLEAEIGATERDLIKEASLRAGTARLNAELHRDYEALVARCVAITALSERCRSRIAHAPKLAVPSVTVIGSPPDVITEISAPNDWAAARATLDQYAARLHRVKAAVDQAETAFATPLAARDDLRGLLGAYATRAARNGLAEDAGLTERYRSAHEALWQAPCDVDAAAPLVEDYLRAVRRAVGADASDISARAVDASAPQGKEDIS